MSGEATIVSGNAAFACRLISVTATIAPYVWGIAALQSVGPDFAFGSATFGCRLGTFASELDRLSSEENRSFADVDR